MKKIALSVASLMALFLFPTAPVAVGEEKSLLEAPERDPYQKLEWAKERKAICGTNALFLYLQLLGQEVPLSRVESELGDPSIGHSLLAVKQAATNLGESSKVVKFDPERIPSEACPAIVYGTQMTERDGKFIGHYFLILKIEEGQVTYMDSTSADVFETTPQDLANKTTGHMIVRESVGEKGPRMLGSLLIGTLGALLITLFFGSRHASH